MDFAWSAEQQGYRDAVARFAREELEDDVVRRDAAGEFAASAWERCAAFGLHGLPVPQEYGGVLADPLTIVAGLEGLGYGCRDNGLLFALNVQLWLCEVPLVRFGTADQKRRYLPDLCRGMIAAHAMTEPGSGSDASSLATTAVRRGDGYLLNGAKTLATNAPRADLFIVFAATERSSGFGRISAFLVHRSDPGVSIGPPVATMGLRTAQIGDVSFVDVPLAKDRMLGRPGGGMAVFMTTMEWARGFLPASGLGTMQRQLERCVDYAKDRRQFGQPIGKFQSVSNRLVDMKLRLETGRLLLHELAWRRSAGLASARDPDSALVKLYVSECLLESSLDAVQVHGGQGYLCDWELERDVRDAVAGRIYAGTSEMQRSIVARHLGF